MIQNSTSVIRYHSHIQGDLSGWHLLKIKLPVVGSPDRIHQIYISTTTDAISRGQMTEMNFIKYQPGGIENIFSRRWFSLESVKILFQVVSSDTVWTCQLTDLKKVKYQFAFYPFYENRNTWCCRSRKPPVAGGVK